MKRAAAAVGVAAVAWAIWNSYGIVTWAYCVNCRERGERPELLDFFLNGIIRGLPKQF